MSSCGLLVVSDVDGTLLDSAGRLGAAPADVRRWLHAEDGRVALTFASSRTAAELAPLCRLLQVTATVIAEDGAVLATCDRRGVTHERLLGTDTATLGAWWTAALDQAALAAIGVRRADTLAPAELQERGVRGAAARRRAIAARRASLMLAIPPHPAAGTPDPFAPIAEQVRRAGHHVARGGRWALLTSTPGKGAAARLVAERLSATSGRRPRLVGIGNDENDLPLLAAADLAFVIRNPGSGPHPALAAVPGAQVLDAVGTDGWRELMQRLSRIA
jgi:predicted mannosyl-3-phosphoglycerate phosphatase (HAD superfamily)